MMGSPRDFRTCSRFLSLNNYTPAFFMYASGSMFIADAID